MASRPIDRFVALRSSHAESLYARTHAYAADKPLPTGELTYPAIGSAEERIDLRFDLNDPPLINDRFRGVNGLARENSLTTSERGAVCFSCETGFAGVPLIRMAALSWPSRRSFRRFSTSETEPKTCRLRAGLVRSIDSHGGFLLDQIRSLLEGSWKVFDAFHSEPAVFKRARTILALTVFPSHLLLPLIRSLRTRINSLSREIHRLCS